MRQMRAAAPARRVSWPLHRGALSQQLAWAFVLRCAHTACRSNQLISCTQYSKYTWLLAKGQLRFSGQTGDRGLWNLESKVRWPNGKSP
eukprot:5175948-Pyramimonas_sp.AAC.1